MKIEQQYKKPLVIAILLHVALLCILIFNLSPSTFRAPPASSAMPTIQVNAISESAVHEQIQKINQAQQMAAHEKLVQEERIEEQKQLAQKEQQEKIAAQKEKIVEQQEKIQAQKQAVIAKQQLILRQSEIAQQKALAQKLLQKKLAVEKAQKLEKQKLAHEAYVKKLAIEKAQKLAAKNKLIAAQKKLQHEMMQQLTSSAQKNISTEVAQVQQQDGKIDKYKAEILALIQSNWRIDQVNGKLKCVYDVSVAPDGSVLSVKLAQSSGNTNLDDSAKQAILASSPLPVPQNPALFNHFRQLVLTLSPQSYLQSVQNS